mmetsp:Transcript_3557/g.13831  ORF Transcript_3557/g.13831 Transcript_3557/m.13831 type:complete len:226 (+) Transcript_3557:125-802(+)
MVAVLWTPSERTTSSSRVGMPCMSGARSQWASPSSSSGRSGSATQSWTSKAVYGAHGLCQVPSVASIAPPTNLSSRSSSKTGAKAWRFEARLDRAVASASASKNPSSVSLSAVVRHRAYIDSTRRRTRRRHDAMQRSTNGAFRSSSSSSSSGTRRPGFDDDDDDEAAAMDMRGQLCLVRPSLLRLLVFAPFREARSGAVRRRKRSRFVGLASSPCERDGTRWSTQ